MLSLLLKDVFVLKKYFLIALAYLVIMSFSLTYTLGPVIAPVLTVAVTYILVLQSCAIDDKSKSELALLSLPLLRKEIVQVKYLTLFVYAVITFLCLIVVRRFIVLFGQSNFSPLTCVTFAATLLAVSLMGAIIYPLYFKFGYIKSKYIFMLTFFTFFFAPGFLIALFKNPGHSPLPKTLSAIFQWISSLSNFSVVFSALLFAAMFTGASYFLSLKFYEKREF